MKDSTGEWIGWGVGDVGPTVAAAKAKLKAKFSYAAGLDNSEAFDQPLQFVLATYQARKNMDGYLPVLRGDGVLDYATQVALGLVQVAAKEKPLLFTVAGTGADWMIGYPADTARAVLDLYQWQGIWYPAAAFPMKDSYLKGIEELCNQVRNWLPRNSTRKCAFAGYSQGGIVVSRFLKYYVIPEGAEFHYLLEQGRILGGVTWGNPDRELGVANGNKFAGWPIPEGRGITGDNLENTPSWWYDFAHGANSAWGRDVYTDTPDGNAGKDMTAIWPIIESVNPTKLFERLAIFAADPAGQVLGVAHAILYAGAFFLGNPPTGPHINYDIAPAVDVLRRIAKN